jgi:alpha-glucan,water dikinase
VFEEVLAAPENSSIKTQIEQLMTHHHQQQPAVAPAAEECHQIMELVLQLQPPAELQQQVQEAAQKLLQRQQQVDLLHSSSSSSLSSAMMISSSDDGALGWEQVWGAVKGVWASQWGPRAQLALAKAQLPANALRMAVLLQPIVPVSYAWVAHTLNPVNGSVDEVYVEIVVGLGEVLVGNYPGRSLGGVVNKAAVKAALQQQGTGAGTLPPASPSKEVLSQNVRVMSYPSKALGLKAPGLETLPGEVGPAIASPTAVAAAVAGVRARAAIMARSDSNAEDLSGFAGAGLFDSVPSTAPTAVLIDYNRDPLVADQQSRLQLMWQVAAAAVAVEEGMGGQHQDVEGGVTKDGRVWVLQARPQV